MDDTWWRKPDQLDEDQQTLIDLPLHGSNVIVGPPGSGKTNLLLLRATFLARAGRPNIAIITFNRLLKEFLITGSGNYAFDTDRIQTFRSWAGEILRENGMKIDPTLEFEEMRAFVLTTLEGIIKRTGDERKYDCILVDEAQDYFVDELKALREFAVDVYAVGDENQRIYEATGALDYLRSFCVAPPALEYHYRNGMAICRLADGIMNILDNGMADTCNYDEDKYPSTVQRVGGLDLQGQVAASIELLSRQTVAYPDEWIGVLAPRKVDVQGVYDALAASPVGHLVQLQKYGEGYSNLDRDRPIIVTTMHSAKGLEYRAVHIFALERVRSLSNAQRLAYTAVTRAKTSLSLYHQGALPGYIERGLVAVEGPPPKPKLADLFGS